MHPAILISVGKQKDSAIAALVDEYRKRMQGRITETVLNASNASTAQRRQEDEARAIRQAVPSSYKMVLLDERGKNPDSPELAALIQKWTEDGFSLAFIIGGADGLHESLRQEAHYCLSFGKLTWPHRMVRAMLYEQIYRAHTINTGHPYHRE
jgi:23S rRNA (pseudouridine1915-N3)-methyltransferase